MGDTDSIPGSCALIPPVGRIFSASSRKTYRKNSRIVSLFVTLRRPLTASADQPVDLMLISPSIAGISPMSTKAAGRHSRFDRLGSAIDPLRRPVDYASGIARGGFRLGSGRAGRGAWRAWTCHDDATSPSMTKNSGAPSAGWPLDEVCSKLCGSFGKCRSGGAVRGRSLCEATNGTRACGPAHPHVRNIIVAQDRIITIFKLRRLFDDHYPSAPSITTVHQRS